MKLSNEWFTALSEHDNGQLVIITGRDYLNQFIESGKFKERIEIKWKYASDSTGMPTEEEAKRMEMMEEALVKAVEKNKLAIHTASYTGGGEKTWVFYTRTMPVFFQELNTALAELEAFPLEFYAEKDLEWEEYKDMYELKKQDDPEMM